MMGAGPVPIPARVAAANSIVINHLGDTMAQIIDQVKTLASYVFQTDSARILGVAGPGSAAMEMAVANLVEPGDRCLCLCNGFFSNRLAELAERAEGKVTRLNAESGSSITVDAFQHHLNIHKPKICLLYTSPSPRD